MTVVVGEAADMESFVSYHWGQNKEGKEKTSNHNKNLFCVCVLCYGIVSYHFSEDLATATNSELQERECAWLIK